MARSKVGVAVIGTGWGATVMIPALRLSPDVEVVAVCAGHLDRAEAAAERFGIPSAYGDVRTLAGADGVDLVCVCTPPPTHHDLAITLLEAGHHIFVTKPLASSVDEAAHLNEVATRQGVVHAVDAGGRYVPVHRYMRDLVADGYLGELRFVSNTYFSSSATTVGSVIYYSSWVSKRPFGGMLHTSLSHTIDRLRFVFGELSDISGATATLIREKPILAAEHRSTYGLDHGGALVIGMEPVDADDTVIMQGRFAGGGLFNVSSSWSLPHGTEDHLEAYGSEGALLLDASGMLYGARLSESGLHPLPVPESYSLPAIPVDARPTELVYAGGRTALYAEFMQDVANVILRRPSLSLFPTFADGLRIAQVEAAVRGES
jgi:predicted dehydrogenase